MFLISYNTSQIKEYHLKSKILLDKGIGASP